MFKNARLQLSRRRLSIAIMTLHAQVVGVSATNYLKLVSTK